MSNRPLLFQKIKKRYDHLKNINEETFQCFPILFLVFAECLFMLDDLHGSLHSLQKLAAHFPNDTGLQTLIHNVKSAILAMQVDDEDHHNCADVLEEDQTISVLHYVRPKPLMEECMIGEQQPQLCIKIQETFNQALTSWQHLQDTLNLEEHVLASELKRLICVESNILEGVLAVTPETWSRLILEGFVEEAIENIPKDSHIQDASKMARVLQSTLTCLESMRDGTENGKRPFDHTFIKALHTQLLEHDEIVTMHVNDAEESSYEMYALLRRGHYRHRAVRVEHNDGKQYVVFCHHQQLQEEMDWFIDQVRLILHHSGLHPLQKSAWIHSAFVSIHPFEDGNGRIGRILGSIPLLQANLPPVAMMAMNKEEYFTALQKVQSGNQDEKDCSSFVALEELEECLLHSLQDAISSLQRLHQ
jgi:Fic family protein